MIITKKTKQFLIWTPRLIALCFVVFIGLLRLDSSKGIALILIDLSPAFLILFFLILAWFWPGLGGSLFILTGLIYLGLTWPALSWSIYILTSGLAFLIGLLFILKKVLVKKDYIT